jgi:hypothetical protein
VRRERDYRRVIVEYPLSPYADDALLSLAELEQARAIARRRTSICSGSCASTRWSCARTCRLAAARLAFEQRTCRAAAR